MKVEKLKILLVDDHRLVLDGIKQVLSDKFDLSMIDVAATVQDALDLIVNSQPYDLLLTDIYFPNTDGYALIEKVHQLNLVIPTIVISSTENIADIKHVMKLGASGFLSKSADSSEMLGAIDEVMRGNIYLSDEILQGMNADLDALEEVQLENEITLSKRQLDTLNLLEQGLTNKQIAAVLCLSEWTVKSHIKALFDHLKVGTRTACVHEARQLNLFR